MLLEVEDLALSFGGVQALSGVDLQLADGVICGLVGPNGAGKTSLFNCISGLYAPTAGHIRVDGLEVTGLPAHRRAGLGVARTFQHPTVQGDRSVLENVLLGGHAVIGSGPLSYGLRLPGARRQERELRARAVELLDYLDIEALAQTPAGTLSYGSLKRVELARALMARPRLLLLDELASGLVHEEVMALARTVTQLRDDLGVGVLMVEHHMGLVATVCDHVVVLVQGRRIAEGTASDVQADPLVVEAYLGIPA